jgi:hypothetical protein
MLHFSGLLLTRATQQECSMTTQQITFSIPPYGTATLTLPELLTPDAFARLDSAIGDALRGPCRDGNTDAANDPGAIEFDSWLIHLH